MTSFNLNYFLKTLSPDTVTLGVRASTYEFEDLGGITQCVMNFLQTGFSHPEKMVFSDLAFYPFPPNTLT